MTRFVSPLLIGCVAVAGVLYQPSFALAQDADATSPGLSSAAQSDAERDEVWNSPEMLEARAELELTFKRSAKITDEQAAKYIADLKAKSPDDMRVWLLQYQEQRSQSQRHQAQASAMRRSSIQGNLPAQSVGSFRNPVAPTGRPVGSTQPPAAVHGGARQVQRPFSGPQYSSANQPLVTSQDMARFEILRGPRPW
jgi:hypothetical protein